MQHIECRNCRLRVHSGLLYETLEHCPRCGAALYPPRTTVAEQLLSALHLRGPNNTEPIDWERITKAQYGDRHYVSRKAGDFPTPHDGGAPPA
jgi:hypothetical protein